MSLIDQNYHLGYVWAFTQSVGFTPTVRNKECYWGKKWVK